MYLRSVALITLILVPLCMCAGPSNGPSNLCENSHCNCDDLNTKQEISCTCKNKDTSVLIITSPPPLSSNIKELSISDCAEVVIMPNTENPSDLQKNDHWFVAASLHINRVHDLRIFPGAFLWAKNVSFSNIAKVTSMPKGTLPPNFKLDSLELKNVTIEVIEEGALDSIDVAAVHWENVTIYKIEEHAINITSRGIWVTFMVINSEIREIESYGFRLDTSMFATFDRCTFVKVRPHGLYVRARRFILSNSEVRGDLEEKALDVEAPLVELNGNVLHSLRRGALMGIAPPSSMEISGRSLHDTEIGTLVFSNNKIHSASPGSLNTLNSSGTKILARTNVLLDCTCEKMGWVWCDRRSEAVFYRTLLDPAQENTCMPVKGVSVLLSSCDQPEEPDLEKCEAYEKGQSTTSTVTDTTESTTIEYSLNTRPFHEKTTEKSKVLHQMSGAYPIHVSNSAVVITMPILLVIVLSS